MALIPLFLMLLAAILIRLARNSTIRAQWGLSASMALIVWISTLALRLGADLKIQLSVWQPPELFQSPLSLSLDPITWPITYSLVTVLAAMVFTSASRKPEPTAATRIFWFVYSAAAFLAVLADNLLTIVVTWTLFDFISGLFLFSLLREEGEIRQVFTRLAIDFLGVLLILAGAAFSLSTGDGAELTNPLGSGLSVVLIALGAFVRLGLLPLHFNLPGLLVVRRGLGTLLRYYPPAIVLAFLAKVFRAGIPDSTLPLFVAAGISGLIIGGFRWILESDSVAGRPFFILLMSGLGVLSAATASTNFMGIVAAAVVLLLAGSVLSLTEIFTPSHRVFAVGAALIQVGIPVFPAGVLSSIAVNQFGQLWPGIIWGIAIVVGLSVSTLGSLHIYFAPEVQWRTGENLARVSYGLGLALPVLSSIGLGLHIMQEFGFMIWVLVGIQLVLVAGGFILLRNITEAGVGRIRINLDRLDPAGFYTSVAGSLARVFSGLRSIADLIEGEAAILWLFAIAVFLVLAAI